MGYFRRVLLGFDQLGNVLTGGDEDETISSRLGKHKRRFGGTIPWGYWVLPRLLDEFLDLVDKNHSIDAIEEDEGLGQ